MKFRRKPKFSGVSIRATAPGQTPCSLPIEVIAAQVWVDHGKLVRGQYPLWDMFWPPPEPEDSGAVYTLVYDEERRR